MIGVLLRVDEKYTLNKEIKEVIDSYNKICLAIYPKTLDEFKEILKDESKMKEYMKYNFKRSVDSEELKYNAMCN